MHWWACTTTIDSTSIFLTKQEGIVTIQTCSRQRLKGALGRYQLVLLLNIALPDFHFRRIFSTHAARSFSTANSALCIEQSPDSALYSCQVQTVDLADCPVHQAVSYAWGPTSPTNNVPIGDRILSVQDSIWRFLTITAINLHQKSEEEHGPPLGTSFHLQQISEISNVSSGDVTCSQ